MVCFLLNAVRLHDSIQDEGFHYLIFDLWVYSSFIREFNVFNCSHSIDTDDTGFAKVPACFVMCNYAIIIIIKSIYIVQSR